MLNLNDTQFRYDPYPIGFARNVLPGELYDELTDNFPSTGLLRHASHMGHNKYLLTEFDGYPYFAFIDSHPAWRTFYEYIKNRTFVEQMLTVLCNAGIDQGLRGAKVGSINFFDKAGAQFVSKTEVEQAGLLAQNNHNAVGVLTSRFEFSALRGNVCSHLPHTDSPRKVISLVLSMMKEGEWQPTWGGGTAVCKPKDMRKNFNYVNNYLDFSEIDVLETFPFVANGCVVFVKTFNSWHAVMPYSVDPNLSRKSIVINIDYISSVYAD